MSRWPRWSQLVERGHALVLQDLHHLVVVDAEHGQVIEDGPGLLVGAVDAVVRHVPVIGGRSTSHACRTSDVVSSRSAWSTGAWRSFKSRIWPA